MPTRAISRLGILLRPLRQHLILLLLRQLEMFLAKVPARVASHRLKSVHSASRHLLTVDGRITDEGNWIALLEAGLDRETFLDVIEAIVTTPHAKDSVE